MGSVAVSHWSNSDFSSTVY